MRSSHFAQNITASSQHLSKVPVCVTPLSHQWAELYWRPVKSLARELIYSPTEAEDAAQEAMLELIQIPDQVAKMVPGDPWKFMKDLATAVITNYRRNEYKHRKTEPSYYDSRVELWKKTGEWFGNKDEG